jgi:hypothetical protein
MKFLYTIRAILREIFEESAYERFCLREGVSNSCESYASFLKEQKQASRRLRCC